jgi:hypothetical protein
MQPPETAPPTTTRPVAGLTLFSTTARRPAFAATRARAAATAAAVAALVLAVCVLYSYWRIRGCALTPAPP